jgi:hypothetical protein
MELLAQCLSSQLRNAILLCSRHCHGYCVQYIPALYLAVKWSVYIMAYLTVSAVLCRPLYLHIRYSIYTLWQLWDWGWASTVSGQFAPSEGESALECSSVFCCTHCVSESPCSPWLLGPCFPFLLPTHAHKFYITAAFFVAWVLFHSVSQIELTFHPSYKVFPLPSRVSSRLWSLILCV